MYTLTYSTTLINLKKNNKITYIVLYIYNINMIILVFLIV